MLRGRFGQKPGPRIRRQGEARIALAEPVVAIARQDIIKVIADEARNQFRDPDPTPVRKPSCRRDGGIRLEQNLSLIDKSEAFREITVDAEARHDLVTPRRLAGHIGELPGIVALEKE